MCFTFGVWLDRGKNLSPAQVNRLCECICRLCRILTGEFLLLRIFSVAISVSPYVCFFLILISMCLS